MIAAKLIMIPRGINVTVVTSGQIGAPFFLTRLIYLSSVERVLEPSDGACAILMFIYVRASTPTTNRRRPPANMRTKGALPQLQPLAPIIVDEIRRLHSLTGFWAGWLLQIARCIFGFGLGKRNGAGLIVAWEEKSCPGRISHSRVPTIVDHVSEGFKRLFHFEGENDRAHQSRRVVSHKKAHIVNTGNEFELLANTNSFR